MPAPYFRPTSSGTRPVPANLSVAKPNGTNTASLTVATGWPTSGTVDIIMYAVDTSNAEVVGSKTTWRATISGTSLSAMSLVAGVEPTTGYAGGSSTVVKMGVTSSWADDIVAGIKLHANDDGSLKTTAVQTALGLGTTTLNGWNALGYAPNTVVYNGNRSYTLTFNGVDLTPTLSAGMRLRTTRTVAAPTQSTSLNGTTQFYSKTAPAGMTFTNNFVAGGWIKLSSYPTGGNVGTINSRYNGTSGWQCVILSTGQVQIVGLSGGASNFTLINSYQSVPLNKWVHIAAQLDMTSATVTGGTNNYIMIDGVDVPCARTLSGTNPTALIQAGNLEIGSYNGGLAGSLFPGKIAQAFVYSAKVTQANIQATISQGLIGTETNLISAYSFNNSINDLNTTNANNLTANGSAVATNADSPFGGQAGGTNSSTLDYAIVQSATFSTNTTLVVQVPEGCTMPTSGGVASVVYSSNAAPYGFPKQREKWAFEAIYRNQDSVAATAGTWYNIGGRQITAPIGEWQETLTGNPFSAGNFFHEVRGTLSKANNTEDNVMTTWVIGVQSGSQGGPQTTLRSAPLSVSSQAVYYFNIRSGNTNTIGLASSTAPDSIRLENAYL